jgi:hypothetical protein
MTRATYDRYVGVRVTPDLWARLELVAARDETTVSAVIRRLVEGGLPARSYDRR